ncbi:MAG: CRISPR-associated protein Cse4, partial [Bacilli bacterium]
RIKKGKELEILDFDIVTRFNPKIEPVYFKQIIPVPLKSTSDFIYEKVDNLEVIKNIINSTFFKKFLSNNYFTEAKDIKLNDFRVKEELLKCRNGYFNWFFKGDKRTVKSFFGDSTLQLVKNSIGLGNYFKAIEQFNVRDALIIYLNGGSDMADKGKMIADHLRQEINGKETGVILTDEEYYFAAGQLAQYILGFNQSNKPTYALINPILNGKTNDKLKENIKHLFLKYDYAIQPSKRFKNLYAMFILYQAEKEKIDEEMLIAGYLYSPLIYEKKVEEEKNNDAE